MHIADNIVDIPVWVGGFAISGAATALSLRRLDESRIALVGVVTAFVFATSFVRIPVPPTSVHLLLYGVSGIILGPLSSLSLLVSFSFQAMLGHGGLTTIGLNATVASGGSLAAWLVFREFGPRRPAIAAVAAVTAAFAVSATLFAFALYLADENLGRIARLVLLPYVPVLLIEAAITSKMVLLLVRVRPEILPFQKHQAPDADKPIES